MKGQNSSNINSQHKQRTHTPPSRVWKGISPARMLGDSIEQH